MSKRLKIVSIDYQHTQSETFPSKVYEFLSLKLSKPLEVGINEVTTRLTIDCYYFFGEDDAQPHGNNEMVLTASVGFYKHPKLLETYDYPPSIDLRNARRRIIRYILTRGIVPASFMYKAF